MTSPLDLLFSSDERFIFVNLFVYEQFFLTLNPVLNKFVERHLDGNKLNSLQIL